MSDDEQEPNPKRSLRSSTRPSLMKEYDAKALSLHFGISLSGSESSDKEFTPPPNDSEFSDSSNDDQLSTDEDDANEEVDSDSYLQQEEEGTKLLATNSDIDLKIDEVTDKPRPHQPLCFVCLETSHHGDIVTCDKCGISVHEGCYGVPEDDGVDDTRSDLSSYSTVPWFCDPCRAGVSHPSCDLCPVEGGLFKQCVNGCWVHMVCGLYCEGVEYVEPELLSGITLDEIPPARWGAKTCMLCEAEWLNQTGVCIQCDAGLCKTYFHATCAQRHGLLCETDDDNSCHDDDGKRGRKKSNDKEIADPYYAHCLLHCDKKIAKEKKYKYNQIMRYLNSYQTPNNSRLERYLSDAKHEYTMLYNKMKEWYHPEHVIKKGTRLLHYHPKAYKVLTEKAKLLGYDTSHMPHQLPRQHFGMVSVGLTVEFVNYFNERTKRIESLKNDQQKLTENSSSLKKKYKNVQEENKQVETELDETKKLCQEKTNEITNLCTKSNTLVGEELFDTKKFISEDIDNELMNHVTNHAHIKCCICNGNHDDHLIVHCDTCPNMYHIKCLDPPLARVPKKTSKIGWQCEDCCCDSENDLKPSKAKETEPQSRFGRKLNNPSWDQSLAPVKVKRYRKRKRLN